MESRCTHWRECIIERAHCTVLWAALSSSHSPCCSAVERKRGAGDHTIRCDCIFASIHRSIWRFGNQKFSLEMPTHSHIILCRVKKRFLSWTWFAVEWLLHESTTQWLTLLKSMHASTMIVCVEDFADESFVRLYENRISALALVDQEARLRGTFSVSDLRGFRPNSFSFFTGSTLFFLCRGTEVCAAAVSFVSVQVLPNRYHISVRMCHM